ncbi:hypothetical protein BJ917_1162 [Pseudomonas sp. WPR_5_2]|nr:hypothetical protein BJ917_1162 [Pseudomonas sp. WPR_5_2]
MFASELAPAVRAFIYFLNIIRNRVFNGSRTHFLKATKPCVVAYGYARIRWLVRLGPGFYRLPVAENSDRVW